MEQAASCVKQQGDPLLARFDYIRAGVTAVNKNYYFGLFLAILDTWG